MTLARRPGLWSNGTIAKRDFHMAAPLVHTIHRDQLSVVKRALALADATTFKLRTNSDHERVLTMVRDALHAVAEVEQSRAP